MNMQLEDAIEICERNTSVTSAALWQRYLNTIRTITPALTEAKKEIERLSAAIDILCTETHFGNNPPSTTRIFVNAGRRNAAIEKAKEVLKEKDVESITKTM